MGEASGPTILAFRPARVDGEADGVLNVNKPAMWTSHDVVAKIKGLLGARKVGHGGTLDPSATGVLPILIGRGTRIAEYLLGWEKEYRAVLRLGQTTDTQDATGVVLTRRSTDGLTEAAIRDTVARFQGVLIQVPPMYSAVKVGGVPLYKVARVGRVVERRPRRIMVHQIEVVGISGSDVALRIVCSKGTYVRTLCADIGGALETGGHLWALERTRVGWLMLEHALTLDDLGRQLVSSRLVERLVPLDEALSAFPALIVEEGAVGRVLHGAPLSRADVQWEPNSVRENDIGRMVRLKDSDGRLLAVAKTAEHRILIEKVLVDAR